MTTEKIPTPVLRYGFRPFFLLASLWGASLTIIWALFWIKGFMPQKVAPPIFWHAYEMIFGYTLAIDAGFLLTAVPNWTGSKHIRGGKLLTLVLLWSLARIVPFLCSVAWLSPCLDAIFLLTLNALLIQPLLSGKRKSNLLFSLILLVFTAVCITVAYGRIEGNFLIEKEAVLVSVGIHIMMISLVACRIIPFFTEKAFEGVEIARTPRFDALCNVSILLSSLLLIRPEILAPSLAVTLFSLTSLLTSIRFFRWFQWKIFQKSILSILYLAYFFIPVGFAMAALSRLNLVNNSATLHVLTAGTLGLMTIGMMTRVALGHTGRKIEACTTTKIIYILIFLAALLRVIPPMISLNQLTHAYACSAFLWALAMLLYFVKYFKILTSPRPDGKAG